jgi:hypothetical protein
VRPAATEREWQTTVVDYATLKGWTHYHTHDSRRSVAGFPDLVLAHASHGIVFAELKTDTGKITEEQWTWIELLRTAGATANIWRPKQWTLVRHVLDGNPPGPTR